MAKLEQTGHFDDSAIQNTCNSNSNSNSNSEEKEEEPQAKLWLLYLLAELEDFEHHTEAALSYIEKALEHTPTCYDLYILKGKVLKHAGALKEAAEAIGFASSLDRGDRFMNSKHVKYLLRAGNIEEADRLAGYWTKRNIMPRVDLREMQACWFEIECGLSHERAGDVVHANKMYHNVVSHFDTFVLDQFDFHPYVLRKVTLQSYFRFLRYVDSIYDHPYYRIAAAGYLRCAIQLAKQSVFSLLSILGPSTSRPI